MSSDTKTYDSLKNPVLEVRNISKNFGSIRALEDVSFTINTGEVVALLGDNGAGKSTLVNCIAGIYPQSTGQIYVRNKEAHITSPQDSRDYGIETVFQDLAVIPEFDIASNLHLNREILHSNPMLRFLGILDRKTMQKNAEKALKRLNARIPSFAEKIKNLSGGQRQAVAIARAVAWGADVIIMDEPTAALGVEQSAQVNDLIKLIASQGVAVILISHNMQHVVETCDRAVVLVHGESAANVTIKDVTTQDLVGLITGGITQDDLRKNKA